MPAIIHFPTNCGGEMELATLWKMEMQYYGKMVCNFREKRLAKNSNYLGEWHTHPEASPNPSVFDILGWKRLLKVTRFDGICLYFVIVGTEQLKVWEGNKHSLEIRLLPHVNNGRGGKHEI